MNKKVKLLIITQKLDINDDILGFFHRWVEEFAKHCEKVTVICLEKGHCDLPENVKVLSLGKECQLCEVEPHTVRGGSTSKKLKYTFNFYKYIFQEQENYDTVFVHMNPEYVVLGGIFWRLWSKKIGLWYAHGCVPFSLKIAEKFTDIIFTSTKSGCRLKSEKIKVVGQGIDVNKFHPTTSYKLPATRFKIISVGRISPVKDYETLIRAVEVLVEDGMELRVDIIGGAGLPEQEKYLVDLKKTVTEKNLENVINFIGPVPNKNILQHLQSADLFVNMSHTGSLDKAILEAMSFELPVLTCNEALKEVLGAYKDVLMYPKNDFKKLAEQMKFIIGMNANERKSLGESLRKIVVKNHSLENFIEKIIKGY